MLSYQKAALHFQPHSCFQRTIFREEDSLNGTLWVVGVYRGHVFGAKFEAGVGAVAGFMSAIRVADLHLEALVGCNAVTNLET